MEAGGLRPDVRDLLDRLDSRGQDMLAQLFTAGGDHVLVVTPDLVEPSVRPYARLLELVAGAGLSLTASGYLPPAVVQELMACLGGEDESIGTHNREHHTLPVLLLRESAQRLRLVRKHRNRLLLTTAGRVVMGRPQTLWTHLAAAMPDGARPVERDAGLLLMIAAAAGGPVTREQGSQLLARGLSSLGWRRSDGALDRHDAFHAARATWDTLHRLGGTGRRKSVDPRPTTVGVAFGRAAIGLPVEAPGRSQP